MKEELDYVPGTEYMIYQRRDLFSFGTDSLLLSAYFKPKGNVLDLGTGNGIIPLRLSKRKSVNRIVGFDIQEEAILLAEKSVSYNKLNEKIILHRDDILNIPEYYNKGSFNTVIANPPYFSNGIKSTNINKSVSRHTEYIDDWITTAAEMLVPEGYFYTMNRPENLTDVIIALRSNNLEPKIICFVKNTMQDRPFLFLIGARKNGRSGIAVEKDLILYEDKKRTKDFMKLYNMEI